MFGAGPGQVFGDGLAGGWALAREGSNPSPSAHISPDNPRTKLPRCLYSPTSEKGSSRKPVCSRERLSRWRELCRRLRRPLIAWRWHVLTWPRRPLPHVSCRWWCLGRGPPPYVAWRRWRFRPRRTLGSDRCPYFGGTGHANAADAQLRSSLLGYLSVCRLNIAEEASEFVVACPVGIQCVHLAGFGPV